MNNQKIDFSDKKIIKDFFNRNGYVLDFSDKDFNDFTCDSINIPLKENYGLSKGKSLEKYIDEAPFNNVIKLLSDLMNYYEETDLINDPIYVELASKYPKCKEVIDKLKGFHAEVESAEKLKDFFNSDYMAAQISLMVKMQEDNPTEAIGKSKELIESCCKTILEKEGIDIGKSWNMPRLVDETFKLFNIIPKNISNEVKGAESIKQVLGNLKAIAQGIAELRNLYGSGHGKSDSYKGLEPRHACLAVGSSTTLVRFLWDSYEHHCLLKDNR